MQLKSVLFGFGLGMVFLSAVFLLVYRFENPQQGLTEEAIIEQAIQIGMIWPEDEYEENEEYESEE